MAVVNATNAREVAELGPFLKALDSLLHAMGKSYSVIYKDGFKDHTDAKVAAIFAGIREEIEALDKAMSSIPLNLTHFQTFSGSYQKFKSINEGNDSADVKAIQAQTRYYQLILSAELFAAEQGFTINRSGSFLSKPPLCLQPSVEETPSILASQPQPAPATYTAVTPVAFSLGGSVGHSVPSSVVSLPPLPDFPLGTSSPDSDDDVLQLALRLSLGATQEPAPPAPRGTSSSSSVESSLMFPSEDPDDLGPGPTLLPPAAQGPVISPLVLPPRTISSIRSAAPHRSDPYSFPSLQDSAGTSLHDLEETMYQRDLQKALKLSLETDGKS
jgi:hypothetical protein